MTKPDKKTKPTTGYRLVEQSDDDEGGSADNQTKSDGISQYMD